MNVEEMASSGPNSNGSLSQLRPPTPEAVLEELFRLLEQYGPTWYTEEHHDRALAALFERDW